MTSLMRAMLFSMFCVLAPSNMVSEAASSDSEDPQREFYAWINKGMVGILPPKIDFGNLPGAKTAVAVLEASAECRLAVGGKYAQYVLPRLHNTTYLGYWVRATRVLENDRMQSLFGYAYVGPRVIVLLQPFWQPKQARAENVSGTSIGPINVLPRMEEAIGLKTGSLTPEIAQALTILHEQAHLNNAIAPDENCMGLSMANTLRIARACTPSIVPSHPREFDTAMVSSCRPN